jgi:hypothetical protein
MVGQGSLPRRLRLLISIDTEARMNRTYLNAHSLGSGAVYLINALEGKLNKKVFCKKYGVDLVRFTHHEKAILHTR